ncbi:lipolytic enzyme [Aulographum hederae CBS 113979]|uniref:Lipolytic enzyme n=1 Tax=Aulographum hederae CBS 113979 TaxID=1176131 RepID=A0A6G1HDH8_9PEZI|nr:lipolytic enzyme [Aulographum hederae CBS 113979]
MVNLYDQFLLFGDSITQQADSQIRGFGFAAALRDDYMRRIEVVNRGLSGYNTDMALTVYDKVIPNPKDSKLRLMSMFFGANDACFPTARNNQCVPIPRFTANLIKMLTHPCLLAHQGVRLILITPPPINEYLQAILDNVKGYEQTRRSAFNTMLYANAVKDVGRDLNIPVVDIWTAIMLKAGWHPGQDGPLPGSEGCPRNEVLDDMLHDGLHLSPNGYKVLYDEMNKLIETCWPDQKADNLPYVLPAWDDWDKWKTFTKQ